MSISRTICVKVQDEYITQINNPLVFHIGDKMKLLFCLDIAEELQLRLENILTGIITISQVETYDEPTEDEETPYMYKSNEIEVVNNTLSWNFEEAQITKEGIYQIQIILQDDTGMLFLPEFSVKVNKPIYEEPSIEPNPEDPEQPVDPDPGNTETEEPTTGETP